MLKITCGPGQGTAAHGTQNRETKRLLAGKRYAIDVRSPLSIQATGKVEVTVKNSADYPMGMQVYAGSEWERDGELLAEHSKGLAHGKRYEFWLSPPARR